MKRRISSIWRENYWKNSEIWNKRKISMMIRERSISNALDKWQAYRLNEIACSNSNSSSKMTMNESLLAFDDDDENVATSLEEILSLSYIE
ncbi:conserved hypothetical protein [Trichinella spiralis]|uniref:hypothetical protein n=1 Tax=Trichinella spiralis TaxID=6334 RepID=UPI0001EFDE8F|nr:conserved hypothetical protein [Trichinella spiralis]